MGDKKELECKCTNRSSFSNSINSVSENNLNTSHTLYFGLHPDYDNNCEALSPKVNMYNGINSFITENVVIEPMKDIVDEDDDKQPKRCLFNIGKRRKEVKHAESEFNDDSKQSHIKSKKRGFTTNLKHSLCSVFKLHKMTTDEKYQDDTPSLKCISHVPISMRCLPPVPFGELNNSVSTPNDNVKSNEENASTEVCRQYEINIEIGTNKAATITTTINNNNNNSNGINVDTCDYNYDDHDDNNNNNNEEKNEMRVNVDFAANFERVKDCGWYWGPISSEDAERLLMDEPDGSFIVRDSSDDHYIFSLTFKLLNCVRHVRIEHTQGSFSFGSYAQFKSQTIVDFIENAMEHSRSGRYLFFLHRRPIHGPMRVQLLHPVSRFKNVQSLQHMCRFVIMKTVRRDLISSLPLPQRLLDYLNESQYYLEQ